MHCLCQRVMGLPDFSHYEYLTLPEGNHSITVYSEGVVTIPDNMTVFWIQSNSTVYITIDTTPPTISNLSLENKTYNQTSIPLSFHINETTSQISYSIDNQAKMTISGNTTLTALPEGYHNIIIYANDTAGNIGHSDYVVFNVSIPPSPSPSIPEFPTTILTVTFLITATVLWTIIFKKKQSKGS